MDDAAYWDRISSAATRASNKHTRIMCFGNVVGLLLLILNYMILGDNWYISFSIFALGLVAFTAFAWPIWRKTWVAVMWMSTSDGVAFARALSARYDKLLSASELDALMLTVHVK